jgi:uncharacterized membrane protein (UPF0127 family)
MKVAMIETDNMCSFACRVADNFFVRLVGLMGRTLAPGDGMLLTPCAQVHSCFMRSCIDVVYLNRRNTVIALDLNMKPFVMGSFVNGCHSVLELCAGDAGRYGIGINTRLIVKERRKELLHG